MEHPQHRAAHRTAVSLIHVVEEILRVGITLRRGAPEIPDGQLLVLLHLPPLEVQLAQGVLGKLVSLIGGLTEPRQARASILAGFLAGQAELSQPVLGVLVAALRRPCQVFKRLRDAVLLQQQLAKGVLGVVVSGVGAAAEPLDGFFRVGHYTSPIAVCLGRDDVALLPELFQLRDSILREGTVGAFLLQRFLCSAVPLRLLVDGAGLLFPRLRDRLPRQRRLVRILRFVVHALVVEGELLPGQRQRLLYHHVPHGLELFLTGKRDALRHLVRVDAADLILHLLPEPVGFRDALVLRQLVHNLIHDALVSRGQIAVDDAPALASGVFEPRRQLLHEPPQAFAFQCAGLHLPDQFRHALGGIPLEAVTVFRFPRVGSDQILLENAGAKGGLDIPDTLGREISLFGIGGEHHHVDVEVFLLLMQRRVPAQVVCGNLIPFGDILSAGVDQRAPILRVGVAQPLRVIAPDGDDGRPDNSRMVCHFLHGAGQHRNLAVAVPESVIPVAPDAGAVGDVVQEVFPLIVRRDKLLPCLVDELRGSFPGRRGAVVRVLHQLLRRWKVPEQAADEFSLTFCLRLCRVVRLKLHRALAGGDVLCVVGQVCRVRAALEVGGDENYSGHASSIQRVVEADLPVGLHDLPHRVGAEAAPVDLVRPEMCGDRVAGHVQLDAPLEQQGADAVAVVCEDAGDQRPQHLAEIVRGVVRFQITDVESERLLYELAAAGAVVRFQHAVHLSEHAGIDPERRFFLDFFFHFYLRGADGAQNAGKPHGMGVPGVTDCGILGFRKIRLRKPNPEKDPHCGALWPDRRRARRRSFILYEKRTGENRPKRGACRAVSASGAGMPPISVAGHTAPNTRRRGGTNAGPLS